MLFNSLDFAIFLPIVFFIYWFLVNRNLKLQNLFIVIASFVFYGWWDWRFLTLILFSIITDYFIGLSLLNQENQKKRNVILWISIIVNLGFLGFFKYYNFFVDNFIAAFSLFGKEIQPNTLNIILPVGISFYTFQTLSYTIDVYRRKLEPTKDFVAFAAFVSFFPQLVAGPIERATNLLPQFYKNRTFDYGKAVDGMRQILWGLFKKIVIADNCANIVNPIFNNYQTEHPYVLILAAVLFAFQIYGDFSGYSDIAIGTAKLFGFQLMTNFKTPYFSRDIAEFWRRWHISLSTWFRDYLYIPLGGSRGSKLMQVRNTFIIFLVSGFWHGANWTFVAWGAINAIYFLPLLLTKQNRINLEIIAKDKLLPTIKELFQMGITFFLTVIAWVFFRAESVYHALDYFKSILTNNVPLSLPNLAVILPLIILIVVEWLFREKEFTLSQWNTKRIYIWSFYVFIGIIILLYAPKTPQSFIYFQF